MQSVTFAGIEWDLPTSHVVNLLEEKGFVVDGEDIEPDQVVATGNMFRHTSTIFCDFADNRLTQIAVLMHIVDNEDIYDVHSEIRDILDTKYEDGEHDGTSSSWKILTRQGACPIMLYMSNDLDGIWIVYESPESYRLALAKIGEERKRNKDDLSELL